MVTPSPNSEAPFAVVVGAGPSGLAAAEALAEAGVLVTVYDRMPSAGRKFLMAGRGGLNLTNSEPLDTFLGRYGTARPDLDPIIHAHPPDALVAWAEALGQATFVGSSGRIFPAAMKASPLLRAWLARLTVLGVEFRMRHTWLGWSAQGQPRIRDDATGTIVDADCNALVLALGGASWPRLGSDGAWQAAFAEQTLPVVPLRPANAGLEIPWSPIVLEKFEGQPLKRIAVTYDGVTQRGEAVITRRGLEGGAVYALAAAIGMGSSRTLTIDLKPDLDYAALAGLLATQRSKDSLSNVLRKQAGLSAAQIAVLREAGKDLPRDPEGLASRIKCLPLTITRVAGLERAISTAGGVPFSALDDGLMLTAKPGTFVAGEMLDWDAPTGGYLLQAAFATGRAAAEGALAWMAARGVSSS